MRSIVGVIAVLLPVTFLAVAQVLLKWRAHSLDGLRLDASAFLKAFGCSYAFWVAMTLAGAALVVWLLLLRKFPLSYVYPFVSLTFPLVALLGTVLLGERLNAGQIVGLTFIVLGVVLNARFGA
jgi:drug/metabolite transporter (DMT)-like permease